MMPPKPEPRAERVSLLRYLRLFRADLLSAQPARLYRAWMAEFRTPFFRSFLVNQPDLVRTVLRQRPQDFPKSGRVAEGLRPLLGNSVFLTNGVEWERQRRIIDPAFEGGRLKDTFPAMKAAAHAALNRLSHQTGEAVEVEEIASHVAADVIFRTLFSLPIEDALAASVYRRFRAFQRHQPILNLGAFLPLPHWMPRFHGRAAGKAAAAIRADIASLVARRLEQIESGTAPDDLATKIMTTADPESGERFTGVEMVDQVAIFFLAGHETSASALAWALYLAATFPEWQTRVAEEVEGQPLDNIGDVARLTISRDVFRETLRLYPPVPMMVREASCPETFRGRKVPAGSQIVISPWHLHRHTRLWSDPDGFDPTRWSGAKDKKARRDAYVPFSAGRRACSGAGFAMIEGPLLLSMILGQFRVQPVADRVPVPVAHLTVRSNDGIWLRFDARNETG